MVPKVLCLVLLQALNDFETSKSVWTGTNCFGQIQFPLGRFKSDFYGPIFVIWTCPKRFGFAQNKLNLSKTICTYHQVIRSFGRSKIIWTVQNYLDGPKSSWIYKRTRHYCLIYILCYLASYYCPDRDEESSGKNRILCVVGRAWSSGHKKMSNEHSEQFDQNLKIHLVFERN